MKWNMKISEIFLTVLFIFLALSSLLTQIPVIRNSIVFFILLLAQLLFVFIFHHNIKKMKIYGTVITALAVSNIINGIIAWLGVSINQQHKRTNKTGNGHTWNCYGKGIIWYVCLPYFRDCNSCFCRMYCFGIYKIPNKKETTAYSQHLKQNGLAQ